jgi:archaellum component FlaF (FlaF/FlaG flagellin family)
MAVASTVMLAMAACTPEGPNSSDGDGALRFQTSIVNETLTRAEENRWHPGDEIGIYAMDRASGTIATHGTHFNARHTTADGDGNFTATSPADAIRIPSGSSAVSFVGYYPWTADVTAAHEYPVDLVNQSDPTKIDLLHARLNSYTLSGNTPRLTFNHELAKVVFNISDQRTTPKSLTGLKVFIKGMDTKGVFDLNGATMKSTSTPGDIEAVVAVNSAGATATAIIFPKTGITYTIEVMLPEDNGEPSTLTFDNRSYQPGERHGYIVHITDGGVNPELVLVNSGGTIEGWTDIDDPTPIIIDKGGNDDTTPLAAPSGITVDSFDASSIAIAWEPVTGATGYEVAYTTTNTTPTTGWTAVTTTSHTFAGLAAGTMYYLWVRATSTNPDYTSPSAAGMVSQTTQGGGGGGEKAQYYLETMGTGSYSSGTRPKIADFTDWDNKAPITYTTQSGANADIRSTSQINAHIWFPNTGAAAGDNDVVISNLPAGYTDITLSYDVAANGTASNANMIEVYANGTLVSGSVDTPITAQNVFVTVSIPIPDGTTQLRFLAPAAKNTQGLRLDNMKLEGRK